MTRSPSVQVGGEGGDADGGMGEGQSPLRYVLMLYIHERRVEEELRVVERDRRGCQEWRKWKKQKERRQSVCLEYRKSHNQKMGHEL